ncbi:MAG: ethylbenzene dehydrogenase-related protein [Planctomycetota bacterium]
MDLIGAIFQGNDGDQEPLVNSPLNRRVFPTFPQGEPSILGLGFARIEPGGFNQERGRAVKRTLLRPVLLLGATAVIMASAVSAAEAELGRPRVLNAQNIPPGTIIIDGDASEAAWDTAPPMRFNTVRGLGRSRNVEMRALYDDDVLYVLAVWDDQSSTESDLINAWVYDAGTGTFSLFPNARPHIYDEAEEDRFAIQWEIGQVKGFSGSGCMSICHGLKSSKPGMRTSNPGERTDEWHWKAARSNPVFVVHDKYVDDTFDPDDVEAGHHGDSPNWYSRNRNADRTGPEYFEPDPTDAEDAKFLFQSEIDGGDAILVAGNEDLLDDGEVIPGRILDESLVFGDVADVVARGVFSDGVWTLEMARALETGSENDVQFDTAGAYDFAVGIFDDSGHAPQHSYSTGAFTLVFDGIGFSR